MADLRVLAKPSASQGIVEELRRLLAEAEAGRVTGMFILTEGSDGQVTHSHDAMGDARIIFWVEIVKARILRGYV